jgi:hypothetical protein
MDRTDKIRKKDRNRQEQTEIDKIRSDIEKYCIIKKFMYHVGYLGANIERYLM